MTDKDGSFRITHLRPDTYRLDVRGWGSATIRLNPDLNKLSNGQIPAYSVQLMETSVLAGLFHWTICSNPDSSGSSPFPILERRDDKYRAEDIVIRKLPSLSVIPTQAVLPVEK